MDSPLRAFELGAMNLVGFFDPGGIIADGSVEKFKRWRQTEITHGRISVQSVLACFADLFNRQPRRTSCKITDAT
eukprot:7115300-Prorocentrum_lima.AAC.1